MARLNAFEQLFQRVKTDYATPVSDLGKRCCSECDLGDGRQPFIDEALKPAQRCPFIASRVQAGQQLAQRQGVIERKAAHLPRGHLRSVEVTTLDCALEASVCRALACHLVMPLGRRQEQLSPA